MRIRTVELASGEPITALGQGTWSMGQDRTRRKDEIAALRLGVDLGMTLIDTAELYGDGATEKLVGTAVSGRRDEVFLVSKVQPRHAGRGATSACERSLRRLGTDHLDLYLLHWREPRTPLAETVEAFSRLVEAGKIRYWGVSNFDLFDLRELGFIPGGYGVQTDQVLYNLRRRGIEWDLLPWCRARGIPIMAYSPLDQGALTSEPLLARIARRHGASPAQIALAWLLGQSGVCVIPKSGDPKHVVENHHALEIRLGVEDLSALERHFPPPSRAIPLEML